MYRLRALGQAGKRITDRTGDESGKGLDPKSHQAAWALARVGSQVLNDQYTKVPGNPKAKGIATQCKA